MQFLRLSRKNTYHFNMLQDLLSHFCWITIVFLQTSNCRRYDIEDEAHKLYSTNLKAVIERFRRTPEYLKILNDQTNLLSKNRQTIIETTLYYHKNKLKIKIIEIFGGNVTQSYITRTIRKLEFNNKLQRPRKKLKRRKSKRLGKKLDNYKEFFSTLTLEEKNRMKELGFEFAGHAIHAMIKNMLPDGALPMSTLLPYGGESPETITTPTHHHDHEPKDSGQDIKEDRDYVGWLHHDYWQNTQPEILICTIKQESYVSKVQYIYITHLSSAGTEAAESKNHHHTHTTHDQS